MSDVICLGIGVMEFLRRELPLFVRSYLILCGILFNLLAAIVLVWG